MAQEAALHDDEEKKKQPRVCVRVDGNMYKSAKPKKKSIGQWSIKWW